MRKIFIPILLVFTFLSLSTSVYASEVYDLATSSNWNLRINGPQGASGGASSAAIYKDVAADIDNNGKSDMIMCFFYVSNQSRSHSGSCYILLDSLLESFSGTGNVLDLADSSSYNIRIDGPVASGWLGYYGGAAVADMDQNGKNDLLLPLPHASYQRASSGSFYILYDNLLEGYSGTGNIIDLASSSNWSIRYDGDVGSSGRHELSESFLRGLDVNNNGIPDIVTGAGHAGDGGNRKGETTIIFDSNISHSHATGQIVDLADSSKYNLRYTGAQFSYSSLLLGIEVVDLNQNNLKDLVIASGIDDNNSRSDSGSVYVIYDSLIDDYVGTGNIIDLTNSNNFNIRFDGTETGASLGYGALATADLDNNSKQDLIIGQAYSSNNSRHANGSNFVIFDSLLDTFDGVGNVLDLNDESNFNLRFDGAYSESYLGGYLSDLHDFDNNGKVDLFLPATGEGANSRDFSGSGYLLYNELFGSYTGTGNTIDLLTLPYSIRYDSPSIEDYAPNIVYQGDFNTDGKYDILYQDVWASPYGRDYAGSLFLIFNFPHSFTNTNSTRTANVAIITGTIDASDSVTSVSGVQYQIDSNDPSGTWENCSADDGNFDSTSETFTCTTSSAPITSGSHTLYVRSYDTNTSYTAQSHYFTYTYTIASPTSSSSDNGESEAEKPQIAQDKDGNVGGEFTPIKDSDTNGQVIHVFIPEYTFDFNAYLYAHVYEKLGKISIKQACGKAWQVGNIQEIWYKAYPGATDKSAAIIIPELQRKSSIISLGYTDQDLVPPGNTKKSFNPRLLKLAHSLDGKKWSIMPNSVVDGEGHSVASIDKVGGYYMIVAGCKK